jgi:hypothetical protein
LLTLEKILSSESSQTIKEDTVVENVILSPPAVNIENVILRQPAVASGLPKPTDKIERKLVKSLVSVWETKMGDFRTG